MIHRKSVKLRWSNSRTMNRKKLMSEAGALIEDVLVSLYLRFIGWANTYYVNATKANDTHKWDFHAKPSKSSARVPSPAYLPLHQFGGNG